MPSSPSQAKLNEHFIDDGHEMPSYDYIVVGAGSAGCIAAARLAERYSVLLLEAGDPASEHPETGSADGFGDAFCNDALMWQRMTTQQKECGNRPLYAGTGRGLGGSGCVNGMVYTRGDERDFAAWPKGWNWADLQPSFAELENRIQPKPREATQFTTRCIEAATACGFARKDGLNDGDLRAVVGYNDMNQQSDQRRSAWQVFIEDAPPQKLDVVANFSVHSLLWDQAGLGIVGVAGKQAGKTQRYRAQREVLLCAGALETPKLLMLSGIGPTDQLDQFSIPVRRNVPAVGQNLQDHPNVCLFYRGQQTVDFAHPQVYGFHAVAQSASEQTAPDSCFVFYSAAGSLRQSVKRMLPMMALPGKLHELSLLKNAIQALVDLAFKIPALRNYVAKVFGIVVILGKPKSRGQLRLQSANPAEPLAIDPAYFSDPEDRQTLINGIDKAKQIAAVMAQQPGGATPMSGAGKTNRPEKIQSWMESAVMTTFHFCGSCRMGDDGASPVDTQLKMKGVNNLRIADASIIPEIPVSAINAPSMLIGWRAAEFILQEAA